LVDLGNTVVCIEHNLDVIKTADWIIDLGPEAGEDGGDVVVAGTPEEVARCSASHTGAALRAVLEAGPRGPREVYDARKLAAAAIEPAEPLALAEGDAAAKLPWERDGRGWHTRDRLSRDGKPVRWKPDVLEWLIQTIESIPGFAPTDWNSRPRVEVKAPGSKNTWFCHARTGGRWLLDVTLRVPPGTFRETGLRRQLGVKPLDERTDLPIYGQWDRVQVTSPTPSYDDVRIHLHDMKDVKRAAFARFLKQAARAYFEMVNQAKTDPAAAEPWKADGQAWHLSQKSIPSTESKRWKPTALLTFVGRLRKIAPKIEFDWSTKTAVMLRYSGVCARIGKIVTNQRWGLKVELQTPTGALTPAQVERLGQWPEIRHHRGLDWVSFWIQSASDSDVSQLAHAVRACLPESAQPEESAS
jgi:excinuclease ABC subunit A